MYLWREEMPQAVRHTLQCHPSEEKNDENDVRKRSGYVHNLRKNYNLMKQIYEIDMTIFNICNEKRLPHLARGCDTLNHTHVDEDPGNA